MDVLNFVGSAPFDCITMGELLDAPAEGHAGSAWSTDETMSVLRETGFTMEDEARCPADDVPQAKAARQRLPLMYSALVRGS